MARGLRPEQLFDVFRLEMGFRFGERGEDLARVDVTVSDFQCHFV